MVFWLLAFAGADGLFFILAIAATARAITKPDAAKPGAPPEKGDGAVLATFLILIAGLSLIMVGAGKATRPGHLTDGGVPAENAKRP